MKEWVKKWRSEDVKKCIERLVWRVSECAKRRPGWLVKWLNVHSGVNEKPGWTPRNCRKGQFGWFGKCVWRVRGYMELHE